MASRVSAHTLGGGLIDLLDPSPDSIRIEDIARGLSLAYRFNGQTTVPYTVAEHSVRCARHGSSPAESLWLLMHDSPEAYIGDLIGPIKHAPEMAWFRELEDALMHAIAEKYDLGPEPACRRAVDRRMLATERRDLVPSSITEEMASHWAGWTDGIEPYDEVIVPWSAQRAEELFAEEFAFLGLLKGVNR